MTEPTHILNHPLSVSQDFKQLKHKGIEYIQSYCGSTWTNYNPSDPGITILEQVCFALTELGYCSDFPIEDILTTSSEQIEYKDQFHLPDEILTTSPVTIPDYRKLIIDDVEEVTNAFIEPVCSAISKVSRAYRVHLHLNSALEESHDRKSSQERQAQVVRQTFYLLNKHRNWGELFLMPQIFRKKVVEISGTIVIDQETDSPQVLRSIQEAFEEFAFPGATQVGFDFLEENGVAPNDVFHGPRLKNGWITDDALGEKCQSMSQEELIDLLSTIAGITYVKNLSFFHEAGVKQVKVNKNELLFVDMVQSIQSGLLDIQCNGKSIYQSGASTPISLAPRSASVTDVGSKVKLKPDLPIGTFRDVNSYYSIQNTFPEAFGVGEAGIDSNATNYQIAQSRQLKGFLTLFDQQLANQFSQLDHVKQLFSFKNTNTNAPTERKSFYARQNKLTPDQQKYPAPFEMFSPTYFCQSLYDIPHIQPLLKGNHTFDYSMDMVENDVLKRDSWRQFKDDPYNIYMRGLMQIMGESSTDLDRRNNILDHLLARHGESPALVDAIIDNKIYTGDEQKGQVIFKSLLLQNLSILSYHRTKSIDYIGADPISDQLDELPNENGPKGQTDRNINFIFDSEALDQTEKIEINDLINHSALELKLSLLFGLQYLYNQYIYECRLGQSSTSNQTESEQERTAQISQWLIEVRKGQICIEPNLLVKCLTFKIAYLNGGKHPQCHVVKERMNYHQALGIEQLFKEDLQQPDVELSESTTVEVSGEPFSVVEVDYCDWADGLWVNIPGTANKIAIQSNFDSGAPIDLNHEIFTYSALLLFPDFIPQINNYGFKSRLDLFLTHTLPVHIEFDTHFVGLEQLETLIPLFCNWRNDLRAVNGSTSTQKTAEDQLEKSALALITVLTQIYEARHG
ncbi:hypothetical protein [Reichenbachiella sp.]|uniref:hypothetical protein n=1 Tax=Reichenbachiella sp. TaxID=2184521 RepID=UPI003BB06A42